MRTQSLERRKLVEKLRIALPLKARARAPLIERLRGTVSIDAARSDLPVTNIFDAGGGIGLMCQLDLTQVCPQAPHLVVPLAHLAFACKYGLDRQLPRYRTRVARAHP